MARNARRGAAQDQPESLDARKRLPWPVAYQELKIHVEQADAGTTPEDLFQSMPRTLRIWARRQRVQYAKGALSPERIGLLQQIHGWDWGTDRTWDGAYALLQDYARSHPTAQVPASYLTEDGFGLGAWAAYQRTSRARGELSAERADKLARLPGWSWSYREAPRLTWAAAHSELCAYIAEHNSACVPWDYTTAEGFHLGRWVYTQRAHRAKGTLNSHRVRLLAELAGWQWEVREAATQRSKTALDEFLSNQGPAIDSRGETAKYRQIAGALAAAIEQKYYQPGDKLPTHSQLIERFSANRDTIRKAIDELDRAGMVVMVPSKGLFVCDEPHKPLTHTQIHDGPDDPDLPQFESLHKPSGEDEWAARRQMIGTRIAQLRRDQNKTQAAIARLSGFSKSTIAGVEQGRRSLRVERLFDIAAALRVAPHELLRIDSP